MAAYVVSASRLASFGWRMTVMEYELTPPNTHQPDNPVSGFDVG